MQRSLALYGMMCMSWWLATAAGAASDTMPVRSFDRFEFDTVTASGLWAEVATGLTTEKSGDTSIDVVTVEPRLVYGGKWAEGGLFIPYHWLSVEQQGFFGMFTDHEDGIGDLQLYGKVVPLRTQWLDAGLGLEISLPTGDESKALGIGTTGFLPYGMAAVHLGLADLRAHAGYEKFLDSKQTFFGGERGLDFVVYGAGLFATLTDQIGARAEVIAQTFTGEGNNAHLLSFEPGIDVRVALSNVLDLFIRPTGTLGLVREAPDWGIGGAVAVAWNPSRVQ